MLEVGRLRLVAPRLAQLLVRLSAWPRTRAVTRPLARLPAGLLPRFLAPISLCAAASMTTAQAWPVLAAPRGAIVEDVGDQIEFNGYATRIRHVILRQSAAEAIAYYHRALGPRSIRRDLGAMTTLAAPLGQHFITVRINPGRGDTGEAFVMVTRLDATARSAPTSVRDLPLPAGSRIINVTEAVDGERRARTVVALHPVALDAAADAIERTLRERGFARVSADDGAAISGPVPHRRFLLYQSDGAQIFVTVTERDGIGMIVYNLVQGK